MHPLYTIKKYVPVVEDSLYNILFLKNDPDINMHMALQGNRVCVCRPSLTTIRRWGKSITMLPYL